MLDTCKRENLMVHLQNGVSGVFVDSLADKQKTQGSGQATLLPSKLTEENF